MRYSPEQDESRREFFRAAGRYSLLAALAAAAALGFRKTQPGREKCVNRGICGACGQFASCGLPAALSARAFRAGNGSTTGGPS